MLAAKPHAGELRATCPAALGSHRATGLRVTVRRQRGRRGSTPAQIVTSGQSCLPSCDFLLPWSLPRGDLGSVLICFGPLVVCLPPCDPLLEVLLPSVSSLEGSSQTSGPSVGPFHALGPVLSPLTGTQVALNQYLLGCSKEGGASTLLVGVYSTCHLCGCTVPQA